MASDSEDEAVVAQICDLVVTNMDSVLLRYPRLWGLEELPERPGDIPIEKIRLPLDDFRSQFHMSRQCFMDLINKITRVTMALHVKKKMMATIWILSTNETYDAVAIRFNFSRGSAHRSFISMLDAVLALFAEYVKWPSNTEYNDISQSFKEKTGGFIPGIIGAIGACHIRINKPSENGEEYCTENRQYSMILQAVCDHRHIFTDVYVGSPGSLSYGTVFYNSNLYQQIENIIPAEYHLVGDTYYPLLKNLVTPFRETGHLSESKQTFNLILSRAEGTIDYAFGQLRGRFKRMDLVEVSNPELVNKIVCTCVTLHNHIRMHDVDEDDVIPNIAAPQKIFISTEEPLDTKQKRKNGSAKRNYLVSLCE